MITNKDGEEIRLITLESLCRYCSCNNQDAHKLIWDDNIKLPERKGYISTCSNQAKGCDGFTLCTTCPIWNMLQSIFCTNVPYNKD